MPPVAPSRLLTHLIRSACTRSTRHSSRLPNSGNGGPVLRRGAATYTSPHQAAQISHIKSLVDKNSTTYIDNESNMGELMQKFNAMHEEAALGGSAKAREKHAARGKMLVRECVNHSQTSLSPADITKSYHRLGRSWNTFPRALRISGPSSLSG